MRMERAMVGIKIDLIIRITDIDNQNPGLILKFAPQQNIPHWISFPFSSLGITLLTYPLSLSLPLSLSKRRRRRRWSYSYESMNLEFRAGEVAVTTESSAGGDSIVCEGDMNQEPCEGMVFESPDAAKAFYDEYARRIGFITRIVSSRRSERDGSIISRRLACNKEGFNLNSKKIGRVRIRNRESKREGCMAMLLVKRDKPGRWVVTKFVKDHSHPLVVTFGKDRPTPDEKDKKIQELSSELNRANRRLAACRDQLQIFMKLVEDHTQCLTGTVEEIVQNIREIESEEQEEDLSVSFSFDT